MQETTNITNISGNINFLSIRKKRFTIDGDENKVIELNTSDVSITTRFAKCYPELTKLATSYSDVTYPSGEDITSEAWEAFGNGIKELDAKMRALVDEIFDSNVADICAPSGLMIDPFDGEFRFEIIVNGLLKLYEDNITSETKKIQNRVKSHTSKYTKKK